MKYRNQFLLALGVLSASAAFGADNQKIQIELALRETQLLQQIVTEPEAIEKLNTTIAYLEESLSESNTKVFRSRAAGYDFPDSPEDEAMSSCYAEYSACSLVAKYLDLNEKWHAIALPSGANPLRIASSVRVAGFVMTDLNRAKLSDDKVEKINLLTNRIKNIAKSYEKTFFRSNSLGHSNPRAAENDALAKCYSQFATCTEAWTNTYRDENGKWFSIARPFP